MKCQKIFEKTVNERSLDIQYDHKTVLELDIQFYLDVDTSMKSFAFRN